MKYMVEVNAKYLVNIEADTALQAEHKILSYNHIWGALAFDQKTMKTDTFAGVVLSCETVSMNELIAMVNETCDTKVLAVKATEESKDADAKVAELEKQLEEAKKAALNAKRAKNETNRFLSLTGSR